MKTKNSKKKQSKLGYLYFYGDELMVDMIKNKLM